MFQGRTLVFLAALMMGALAQAAQDFPAVPGEYVVKLKESTIISSTNVLSSLGAESFRKVNDESGAYVVVRSKDEDQKQALRLLNSNPYIEYAEPNYIYTIVGGSTELPNDPKLSELWGLINDGRKTVGDAGEVAGLAGFDINAQAAWALETGSRDIKIAVIDTGVDYLQPDLAPNMWVNMAELNGQPGVDDDGNGCVDDIHGCDFANNDGDPRDDNGHGSHVSGTIGAAANNEKDIVGVTWNTTIIGVKFLARSGGGTLENAIKSIDYATANGVHIMSNSWGGGGFSQALLESIRRARDAGILFVAAAGNNGVNMERVPQYPAGYDVDNIISVAAVDSSGRLASFSNYGRNVHVAAPGVNILSVTPNGLKSMSGTSMACPHVSGVAALLYSQDPAQTYTQVKERILAGARPIAALNGKVSTGMVDAYYALSTETPPEDPNDPSGWEVIPYQVSTPHPYSDDFTMEFTFEVSGASKMALKFSSFDTESGYDTLSFYDEDGNLLGRMSGNLGETFSPVLTASKVKAVFKTDRSQTRQGFDVVGIAYK